MFEFFDSVKQCLCEPIPSRKQRLSSELVEKWQHVAIDPKAQALIEPVDTPGTPEKPKLVAPRDLPNRSRSSPEGHAALIHAIAHIEFNAINLALDAIHRFDDLPEAYYRDWLTVVGEESLHFSLINTHLQFLGFQYGDFDAHNGLWEIAERTKHDVLVRMALVPRVFEARGLDVTPGIINKLHSIGDSAAEEILQIILRDEIGHVETGTRWFNYICDQRNLPQNTTFIDLIRNYLKGSIKLPLQREIRLKAGFSSDELNLLEQLASSGRCKR